MKSWCQGYVIPTSDIKIGGGRIASTRTVGCNTLIFALVRFFTQFDLEGTCMDIKYIPKEIVKT